MAEWLGSALQKLLQRFESASDLNEQKESPVIIAIAGLFCFCVLTHVLTFMNTVEFHYSDLDNSRIIPEVNSWILMLDP